MASLQQKLNPILVNNVIGYHALDPPVSGPHELHERGLVVLPLPFQAVQVIYFPKLRHFGLPHLSLGGYLSQPSSRVISKSLEAR